MSYKVIGSTRAKRCGRTELRARREREVDMCLGYSCDRASQSKLERTAKPDQLV